MYLLVIKSWSNVDSGHELAMEDDVEQAAIKQTAVSSHSSQYLLHY